MRGGMKPVWGGGGDFGGGTVGATHRSGDGDSDPTAKTLPLALQTSNRSAPSNIIVPRANVSLDHALLLLMGYLSLLFNCSARSPTAAVGLGSVGRPSPNGPTGVTAMLTLPPAPSTPARSQIAPPPGWEDLRRPLRIADCGLRNARHPSHWPKLVSMRPCQEA